VRRGRNARVGALPQLPVLPQGTVRSAACDGLDQEWQGEAMLTRLGMGGLLDTPTDQLSGGQKKRVALGGLLAREWDALILDEPTNHLDLEAIEALVEGIKGYDGTLIFVSHDRWFVSQLANRIFEISPKGINDFRGSFDEYLERLGDDHLDAEAVLRMKREQKKKAALAAAAPVETDPAEARRRQQRQKELAKKLEQVTAGVEQAESRVNAINELFCDPTFFDRTSREQVKKLEAEQKTLSGKIEELMGQWEKIETEMGELGT
jgi:ATPase subunit of ABC transporter with duplicated ATPase domains